MCRREKLFSSRLCFQLAGWPQARRSASPGQKSSQERCGKSSKAPQPSHTVSSVGLSAVPPDGSLHAAVCPALACLPGASGFKRGEDIKPITREIILQLGDEWGALRVLKKRVGEASPGSSQSNKKQSREPACCLLIHSTLHDCRCCAAGVSKTAVPAPGAHSPAREPEINDTTTHAQRSIY